MSIAEKLLSEFVLQIPITKKFLERLPKDKLAWKPHERAMTAGQLALHLALVPGGVLASAMKDFIEPPSFSFPQPDSTEQIMRAYEESIATVRQLMMTLDDAAMASTWRIMDGDKELLALPRETFIRDIMFNHWYQHRGQFSVYLRLLGQLVPASWGPSADELPPLTGQNADQFREGSS